MDETGGEKSVSGLERAVLAGAGIQEATHGVSQELKQTITAGKSSQRTTECVLKTDNSPALSEEWALSKVA